MDLHEEIRFRVTNINFTRVTKTATGGSCYHSLSLSLSLGSRHTCICDWLPGIQATTTEASDKTAADGDLRQSLARRRSSSVDLSDSDPTPSAIHILVRAHVSCCSASRADGSGANVCCCWQGTIDEDGLGLTSWWVN